MGEVLRRYFHSMGSVLDIMPATDYSKGLSKGSDTQRLKSDIRAISKDIASVVVREDKQRVDNKGKATHE